MADDRARLVGNPPGAVPEPGRRKKWQRLLMLATLITKLPLRKTCNGAVDVMLQHKLRGRVNAAHATAALHEKKELCLISGC